MRKLFALLLTLALLFTLALPAAAASETCTVGEYVEISLYYLDYINSESLEGITYHTQLPPGMEIGLIYESEITLFGTPTEAKTYHLSGIFDTQDDDGQHSTEWSVTLTVLPKPEKLAIAQQPANVTAKEDTLTSFSVKATGGKPPYQYEWFCSNGKSLGIGGSSLTVEADDDKDGYSYWCVITDSANTQVTSNKAKLTVTPEIEPLKITKHPTPETVTEGGKALFVARADNAEKIAWELVSPGGDVYAHNEITNKFPSMVVKGGTEETLSLSNIPLGMNGWSARCVFTGEDGTKQVSSGAKLTVKEKEEETEPPTEAPTQPPTEAPTQPPTEPPTQPPTEAPTTPTETLPPIVIDGPEPDYPTQQKAGVPWWTVVLIVLLVAIAGVLAVLLVVLRSSGKSGRFSQPTIRCSRCGWTPETGEGNHRFCPNCGTPMGRNTR